MWITTGCGIVFVVLSAVQCQRYIKSRQAHYRNSAGLYAVIGVAYVVLGLIK